MKCTELITQDHAVLRRGLDILDGMVMRLEDGLRIDIADVNAILKFLQLFVERSEERAVVSEVEAALNSKSGIAFVRSSRQLTTLLRHHLDKEDAALREIAEISPSMNFTRLEWKYIFIRGQKKLVNRS